MKKLLLTMLLVLFASATWAADVTLMWDANPAAENVTGYTMFYGPISRFEPAFTAYETQIDAGPATQLIVPLPDLPPSVTHPGGPDGTRAYCFAVVSYNAQALVSGYSNEVCIAALTVPGGMRHTVLLTWPDIDGDGDVDGQDLAVFTQVYGLFAAGD